MRFIPHTRDEWLMGISWIALHAFFKLSTSSFLFHPLERRSILIFILWEKHICLDRKIEICILKFREREKKERRTALLWTHSFFLYWHFSTTLFAGRTKLYRNLEWILAYDTLWNESNATEELNRTTHIHRHTKSSFKTSRIDRRQSKRDSTRTDRGKLGCKKLLLHFLFYYLSMGIFLL